MGGGENPDLYITERVFPLREMLMLSLCLKDLPPIEELKITVDDTVVMKELGTVSSVIGPLGENGLILYL